MKWDNIKNYLIVLLALVNVFFTAMLFIQHYSINYIPKSELDQLTGLFAGGYVQVPDGALPAKKQSPTVYGGDYQETYYETAVELLSGSSVWTTYITMNGMNFVMRDGDGTNESGDTYDDGDTRDEGDTYEFKYPFGFEYVYRGDKANDYALEIDSDYLAGLPKVNYIRALQTLGTIKRFLYADGALNGSEISGGLRIKLKAKAVYYDAISGLYIAEIAQYAGGQPVYGCEAVAAVSENKVVFVSGSLILCNLDESYNIELRDQVNLMLFEKRELSQLQTEEGHIAIESGDGIYDENESDPETADGFAAEADTDSETTSAETVTRTAAETSAAYTDGTASENDLESGTDSGDDEIYILTSAESCYCITWDAERSRFYLLPGWKFIYNNSVIRIRDAVDGSIYTK